MTPQEGETPRRRASDIPSPIVEWLKRFAALWGFLLFVLVVLVTFRAIVLPFVLGILVAYVLAPLVDRMSRPNARGRSLPRGVSVLLVYVVLAGAISIFLTAFLPRLSADVTRLVSEAPASLRKMQHEYVPRIEAWMDTTFAQEKSSLPPRPERKLTVTQTQPGKYEVSLEGMELELEPMGKGRYVVGPRDDGDAKRTPVSELFATALHSTESEVSSIVKVGQRFVASVAKGFAWFVLTFMVAAYLLIDLERVRAFLRSLVPPIYREDLDEILTRFDRGLAGVIRGQLIICLVNGVLTTIGLILFHVKYSVLLGVVAGVMSFIPVFGSILSSVPIVTMALVSGGEGASLSTGLAVLAWIVGIHFLEANLFNPKIMGSAAKIHPLVVVFALLGGEHVGGLIGALLAVPIASMVQVLFVYFREQKAKAGEPV